MITDTPGSPHIEPDPASGRNIMVPCFSEIDRARIHDQLERDHFFWLDLADPTTEQVMQLGAIFGFHPLALEDTCNFGQRPKIDDYGEYVFLVYYGAREHQADDEPLREVHFYISGKYVITIHREPLPALEVERERMGTRRMHSEQFVIYRVLDALTDTFFPLLAWMDDAIDEIEDAIVTNVDQRQLGRIFELKRDLVSMRKVVTPMRDMFSRSVDAIGELPGLTVDERDYFRDIYDHLIRISDLIDSYRDLLSGAMDVYLSTVGNRQNEVMKQLAIIATIFLPLTFLTGFFGQNFSWLVGDISGPAKFFIFGIGGLAVSLAILMVYFKRKRWF